LFFGNSTSDTWLATDKRRPLISIFEVKLELCSCLGLLGHSNGVSGLEIYNDGRKHSRRHFLNVQPGWDLVRKGGRKKSLKSSVSDSFRVLIPSSEKL
jgi:hypothetical protein